MNPPGRRDRRREIVEAGLDVLRAHGYPGFTQPRVAAEVGMRQSHLTYYFPTRADLLEAVARAAAEGQLNAVDAMAEGASIDATAAVLAHLAGRQENTRVLLALAQAADQEPAIREVFRHLAEGVWQRAGKLLETLGIPATEENRLLLHALAVGLSVVDLAVAHPHAERRMTAVIATALNAMKTGR